MLTLLSVDKALRQISFVLHKGISKALRQK
nr:MAG TPA: hypothetical protein [Caudoviricetes sp.]